MRSSVVFFVLCLFLLYLFRVDRSIEILVPTYQVFKHVYDEVNENRELQDISSASPVVHCTAEDVYLCHKNSRYGENSAVGDFRELVIYKRKMLADCDKTR